MKKYIIQFTERQAESLGLLICECGHPKNNHFRFDGKPCAHCNCKKYKEVIKVGILLNVIAKENQ